MFLIGCASGPTFHGIPNFAVVVAPTNGIPGIYRGGEPDVEGNAYLASLGVTRQIKLNSEADTFGTTNSFEVVRVEINTWEQIFGFGLDTKIKKAAEVMTPGSFVHCEFGRNRTGTVVGYFRVKEGWTKERALIEMNTYGWGDSLPGLKWFWYDRVK